MVDIIIMGTEEEIECVFKTLNQSDWCPFDRKMCLKNSKDSCENCIRKEVKIIIREEEQDAE